MKRLVVALVVIAIGSVPARANDWGMGEANAHIAAGGVFNPVSTPAHQISTLAIFAIAITAAIFVVVGALLAFAIVRFRVRRGDDGREPPQVYGSSSIELAWTIVPILVVFVLILATVHTIYTVQAALRPPDAISVRVIAHQWWWEFRYPELGVVTANEIHVPISDPEHPSPTFISLQSADVAHSFWVPRLAGKTDVIPNKTNSMWIDPHQAGTYLGQCAEFCGAEHAMMLIRVVVEPREQWERWIAAQRRAASNDPASRRGRIVFETTACINCHTVRGTPANGTYGPDLTHLMSRETFGAGAATNTREHLKVWLRDPSVMKPGVLMPAMNLGEPQLNDLVKYLAALQ